MKKVSKTKKQISVEQMLLKEIKELKKIINKKPIKKREDGSNLELWSDGEYRIHRELSELKHTSIVRYMLGGVQICFRMSELNIPRKGDVIGIKYLSGDDEVIELMEKTFKENAVFEYMWTQHFHFIVDSVIKEIDGTYTNDLDAIEYIVNLTPDISLTRKVLTEKI